MDHVDIQTKRDAAQDVGALPSLKINIPTAAPRASSLRWERPARNRSSVTPEAAETARPASPAAHSPHAAAVPTLDAVGVLPLQKPTLVGVPLHVSKWIPDEVVMTCQADDCGQLFSLFNRKHHCRTCGGVFCANCSTSTVPAIQGGTLRVCVRCYYDHQLVVPKQVGGQRRRRSRGEFKLLPAAILVEFCSFLTPHDLAFVSLVSSDFYFASRSNAVWALLGVLRWAHSDSPPLITTRPGHTRFDYTQFLGYVQRTTQARCDGVATFASGVRQLLSQRLKIAIVGPSGVGKTSLVRHFIGSTDAPGNRLSTVGFVSHNKRVALVGGLATETTLTIYDTSGVARYESLRSLCCTNSHVVILCYNVHSKLSLVEAAVTMGEIEPHLTSQVVVVCGINSELAQPGASATRPREVTERDAEAASVRCRRSLQVSPRTAAEAFEAAVQAVVDRIVSGVPLSLPTPTVLDVLLEP